MSDVTRRAVLAAGAGGAGVALLAACSSGGSDDRSAAASDPADSSSGAESSSASSSPESSGSSGSSAAGDSGADSLAKLDDITVGEAKSVKLPNGKPGLVTRTGQGTAVCFSAICTHEGCTVKPDGKKLACPCHGSTFEAATGKVLGGPAPTALAKVDVKVVGGNVVAG